MPALRVPGRTLHHARASHPLLNALILVGCAQIDGACARADAAAADRAHEVAIGLALNPALPGQLSAERGAALALETLAAAPGARARALHFTLRTAARGPRPATPDPLADAARLRDDPDVIGIVGDPDLAHTQPARSRDPLPVIEDAAHDGARALAMITPTATSTNLVGRSPWLFRLSPDDETSARLTALHVADSLGARQVALVYRNDTYGRDWAAAFARTFERRGGTLLTRDPYLADVTDWAVYARYLASRHADLILFPGSAEDAAELLRALRTLGDHTPLLGGGELATLADSAQLAGTHFTTPFASAASEHPSAPAAGRAFAARYRARYGERPDARAALAYEGALVLGHAAIAVDLSQPDRRRRVRDQLLALGHTTPAVAGVVGPIAFDARHGVIGRGVMIAPVGTAPIGPEPRRLTRVAASAPAPAADSHTPGARP